MKTRIIAPLLTLVLLGAAGAWAQKSPSERRAFREYTSPEELVSIAPTTTLDKALQAISEVSRKFVGKIIIDTERREFPINVDIQGIPWREALEAICRKNDIWYTEYETYIQLTGGGGVVSTASGGAAPGIAVAGGTTGILPEIASIRSREIQISAVFFEVNLSRLDEVGLDWNFIKRTSDFDITGEFSGASRVSSTIFKTEITPKLSFATIDLVARFFSSYDLGEILSNPQIIVRSGEEGRIQVGADFSVKERDFAGNLIDRFYSTGTIIKVKPQVMTEQGVNFVHLIIDVERSNVTPGTVTTIINKTKANTNVLLLDGEETIIGGLYNTEIVTTRTGIPFLKDLPWYVLGLRYLFGYERLEDKKKELVILLKAELVPTLQERITQKKEETKIFDRWEKERETVERRMKGN